MAIDRPSHVSDDQAQRDGEGVGREQLARPPPFLHAVSAPRVNFEPVVRRRNGAPDGDESNVDEHEGADISQVQANRHAYVPQLWVDEEGRHSQQLSHNGPEDERVANKEEPHLRPAPGVQ
eukprot:scaffold32864_cov28-Tisochrysis_lutea.AAC.6